MGRNAQREPEKCLVPSRLAVKTSLSVRRRAITISGMSGGPSTKAGSYKLHRRLGVVAFKLSSALTVEANCELTMQRNLPFANARFLEVQLERTLFATF